MNVKTAWILGDQLSRSGTALAGASPTDTRILMIESSSAIGGRPFHRQRLHVVLASMRRFAEELEADGYSVDYRAAGTFGEGLRNHRTEHQPDEIVVMEATSWDMQAMLRGLDVRVARSNQFLCHYEDFAAWADGRPRLVMEDFYRWQRMRLGYLMDGDLPAGGAWNHDAANREPPDPTDTDWPEPPGFILTDTDTAVIDALPASAFGRAPDGSWATCRTDALTRLDHFVESILPRFGPNQDAMLTGRWSMRHSLLSPYLNLGLLHPSEVCDAVEGAYRAGHVPIESAEGFIRQVIGWREYVWGVYWLWMPEYRDSNGLDAQRPLPPVFSGATTEMHCVAETLAAVHDHGYAHHIQRLMVIANLGLIAGIRPVELTGWMRDSFVDGGDWVMQPNVIGMGLYADGGSMATKPYAAGGNYINRMSDYCGSCRYDPRKRTGPDACPYTTLYWDFLDRNHDRLAGNHRISRQLGGARRLADMPQVRERALDVLDALDRGEL
ncbi:MAG: cryptochrome/photolyase family protein [Acidimicrobiia bacterium]